MQGGNNNYRMRYNAGTDPSQPRTEHAIRGPSLVRAGPVARTTESKDIQYMGSPCIREYDRRYVSSLGRLKGEGNSATACATRDRDWQKLSHFSSRLIAQEEAAVACGQKSESPL